MRSLSRASWKRASATVRVPWAVGLALFTAVSALAFGLMGQESSSGVSQEVLDSQEQVTMDMALGVQGSLVEGLADLDVAAEALTAKSMSAAQVLDSLAARVGRWSSVLLVDAESGNPVAARGTPLEPQAYRSRLDQRVALWNTPGDMQVLQFSPAMFDGRDHVLVAVAKPRLRCPNQAAAASAETTPSTGCEVLNQGNAWLVESEGRVVTGTTPYPSGRLAQTLIETAIESRRDTNPHAYVSARTAQGQEVVSFAPVARETEAHRLGLTLVTLRSVTARDTIPLDSQVGKIIGLRLFGLSLLVFALLYAGLVYPILQLQRDALRLANGGLSLHPHRPWLLALEENRHTAYALQIMLRQLLSSRGPEVVPQGSRAAQRALRTQPSPAAFYGMKLPKSRTGDFVRSIRPSVLWPWSFGLVMLLAFGFTLPLAVRVDTKDPQVPQLALADQRNRVASLSESIRRGLNESVEDLRAAADLMDADNSQRADATSWPDQLLLALEKHHGRYSGLFVADPSGRVTHHVGDAPARLTGPLPRTVGLVQPNREGAVPLVYGFAPLRSGSVLVGQYDPQRLQRHLDRRGMGSLWLANGDRGVIASNHGFRAFQPLPHQVYQDAATQALAGHSGVAVRAIDGQSTVITWHPVTGRGPSGQVRWALVSAKPVSRLALAPFQLQREALMLLAVVGTSTVLIFGWLYILVIRPWRQAARAAKQLANGDLRRELYPERLDEIGLTVRALERLRQSLRASRGMSTAHRFSDPRDGRE